MYRSNEVIRPKARIRVVMQRGDGSTLDGWVFVSGQERVLDLLNSKEPYLPFECADGRFVMINKSAIAYVWPEDTERMQKSYAVAPVSTAPVRRSEIERD